MYSIRVPFLAGPRGMVKMDDVVVGLEGLLIIGNEYVTTT